MNRVNRWLLRPRVMAGIALAVFACIVLFQWPASPASGARFTTLTGEAPFDERPAGYALSGVLAAFLASPSAAPPGSPAGPSPSASPTGSPTTPDVPRDPDRAVRRLARQEDKLSLFDRQQAFTARSGAFARLLASMAAAAAQQAVGLGHRPRPSGGPR